MNVFQALILGLVQGLTEFLPVSSSGHLVLFQRILNTDLGGADVFFDLLLHIGTLLAVCIVMRHDIFQLIKSPRRLFYLFVASLPAAAAGILLGDIVDSAFGGGYLFAGFAITAALLTAAMIYSAKKSPSLPLNLKSAAVMGLAQAVAILPGISRSGATVAAGIFCGTSREEAARFSFLMSIPVIGGGFLIKLYKLFSEGGVASAFASTQNFALCAAVSVAASAFSGLFAVKIMLKSAVSAKYTPFIIYLCLLTCLCAGLHFYGAL